MLNELYDTTISRLTIHAPAHLQEDVRRELQYADWPDAGSEQIVFVRKLSVTAPHTEIGRLLLNEAAHQVRHSNDSENVIRFANHLEMLATLLADLASGLAADRWYWRRWIHLFTLSTSRAIYSILADNLTQLNALAETLAHQRQLEIVWQNLAEEDAKQLIEELSWKNGYSLPEQATKPTDETTPLQIPHRILERWQHALNFGPTSNRFRLAILLIAQEYAPLALIKRADLTLSQVSVSIEKLQPGDQDTIKPYAQEQWISAESSQERALDSSRMPITLSEKLMPEEKAQQPESQLLGHSQSVHTKESQRLPAERDAQSKTQHDFKEIIPAPVYSWQEDQSRSPVDTALEIQRSAPHPLERIQIQTQPETSIAQQFNTQQGGVLYLLNFLNRPTLQTIMGEHWQQLPNGWIWLYRLAELLSFNNLDPIALFFVEQLGLESDDELAKLPPLPEREHIEMLAEQWYGSTEVWQPSLLSLPARIRYTASHIDMFSALSNVRLDLRLTGLDINPGWLPWLGRVVQFHFDQHGGL